MPQHSNRPAARLRYHIPMLPRRDFLALASAAPLLAQAPLSPLLEPHFPNRACQFLWRNWELANLPRLAAVLKTSPANLLALARTLGLPPKLTLTDDQLRRIYVTVIRQNWHLLPTAQLTQLLGWTPERLAFTLKEDDFLDHKLGPQPACEPVRYAPLTPAETQAAATLRQTLQRAFGPLLHRPGRPLCSFVADLSNPANPPLTPRHPGPGFTLTPTGNPQLQAAGQRFLRFLRESFGGAPGQLTLSLNPALPGSRTTITAPHSIHVEAVHLAELIQALYTLQDRMEALESPALPPGVTQSRTVWSPRFLYSYFALYGDPLMEPEADPFPDAYLEKLARAGINGVWLQGVLNTLAPSPLFPEFGQDSATRLQNLKALTERAAAYGVRVYLYLNEPRALPAAFFSKHPTLRGSRFQNLYALCTSQPAVRQWIRDSLAHVFRAAPQLGGVFTISMSENHTNCFSHGGAWGVPPPNAGDCPRCNSRPAADVLAELFRAMHEGIRQSSPTAEIIHYDWGWPDEMVAPLVSQLPPDTRIVSISEWSVPVERGGVRSAVGEYSISVVGPGPRATRNWAAAKKAGLTNLAKVQFNNTWELSAVPYIPVPQLILQHCRNLRQSGVSGLMAAWTCGGYPSPNLHAAKAYYADPVPSDAEILTQVARQRYGAGHQAAVAAWQIFSDAFLEFPYGVSIYILPLQHGPAHLLRPQPTGLKPGMILFPHDAYKAWCGRYPPEVVEQQLTKLAQAWKPGLARLAEALAQAPRAKRPNAAQDLAIAQTCYHHFQSVANQVEYYRLRDAANPAHRPRIRQLLESELALARAQYPIARQFPVIGYEASNHYYYTPLDLAEKVLQCQHLLRNL